jgi:hypothetical protein
MAGKTKTLRSFQHGIYQAFEVSSSLGNVFITNLHTIDISVYMLVALDNYPDTLILNGVIIPPNVTLNVLENQPLKIKNTKSSIRYECADSEDDKMGVTYTAQ